MTVRDARGHSEKTAIDGQPRSVYGVSFISDCTTLSSLLICRFFSCNCVPTATVTTATTLCQSLAGTADKKDAQWITVDKHWLYETDRRRIVANEWLNDRIVYVAMLLTKKLVPEMNGFKCTLTTKSAHCGTIKSPFVQILNVNGNHWLTVASAAEDPLTVNVYDSLNRHLSRDCIQQIETILCISKNEMKIVLHDKVLQQLNGNDCGLHAIANCVELALHRDPCQANYDTWNMRTHLFSCLITKKMSPFPKIQDSQGSEKPTV